MPQTELEGLLREMGVEISQSQISDYESTKKPALPNASYIAAFCELLDVNPVWLLTGQPPERWNVEGEGARRRAIIAAWLTRVAEGLRSGEGWGEIDPEDVTPDDDLDEAHG